MDKGHRSERGACLGLTEVLVKDKGLRFIFVIQHNRLRSEISETCMLTAEDLDCSFEILESFCIPTADESRRAFMHALAG